MNSTIFMTKSRHNSCACLPSPIAGPSTERAKSPRRRVAVSPCRVLSLLLLALPLSSCHGTQRKTIAVIPKATAHLFWVSVHAGAMAAAEKYNVEVLWNGPPSETDYARQVQIVDSMIARQVDGLAVAAQDRTTLNASLERAAAAH